MYRGDKWVERMKHQTDSGREPTFALYFQLRPHRIGDGAEDNRSIHTSFFKYISPFDDTGLAPTACRAIPIILFKHSFSIQFFEFSANVILELMNKLYPV